MRKLGVVGVVMVAALTGSGAPRAQTPAPTQRVWTGTLEEHDSWEGSSEFGRSQSQISFVYVEGRDEFGLARWESRRLTWSAVWEDHRFDRVWVEKYGDVDERGIYSNRSRMDIVTVCSGGGTLELGPSAHDVLTPEQKAQLRPSCVTTYRQREAGPTPPPTLSQRDALDAPSLPNEDQLTGCAYERTWLMGNRGGGSLSVSVSAPVTAVMEVDPQGEYGKFVPVPGETLTFVASVPAGTARFRFELDPGATSRFPGYATNAYNDHLFFAKHPRVAHLNEKYIDYDPDLIFDPAQFPASEWSRAEFLVVETARPQSAAVVTVTAMDYGAVGRLRAFVKSDQCGDWQPVSIRVGTRASDFVAIPLDEDANLMADALEPYRGMDSGADEDAEPTGNGISGDGLTAFEEYRGFAIRGAHCGETADALREVGVTPSDVPGAGEEHVRTPPRQKNVFVHADDPLLATLVPEFGWATNLSALAICEEGYGGNSFRVVNYTLQEWGVGSTWQGYTVTREPQHGLWLKRVDETSVPGLKGLAVGVTPEAMGPPELTTVVEIAKPLFLPNPLLRAYVGYPTRTDLMITMRHELGHGVGVPHHGADAADWRTVPGPGDVVARLSPRLRAGGPPDFALAVEPSEIPDALLVDPGSTCTKDDDTAAFSDESLTKFVGCVAANIIRRGQQHSGDMTCPMRIPTGDRYEPPGVVARYLWHGPVYWRQADTPGATRLTVDAWGGRLLRYQNQLEEPTLGRYCTTAQGTGINAPRGDLDHAGENGRRKPCTEFVVVKDSAAP